jgi:hypothetical protein
MSEAPAVQSSPSSVSATPEAGWSGMETPGMKEAKCSLLLAVDGSFEPKIKSLPDQRVLVYQDKAFNPATTETNCFYVDFAGCTLMQLEPLAGTVPKTMPVTLTVAGKCYFTAENYKDFKTLMRTKEESERLSIPPNGCFDWPDVQSMLLCPLCSKIAPIPKEDEANDGNDYWMLFYPLLQITVMKGSKMTLGTRTICRLTCVDCMHDLLDGMTLTVKQSPSGSDSRRPSMLSFSLSALEILEEAGSASFLQDGAPRPESHPHVDDEMDAWTLYNLWEHSGAWEALQNDYRIVLSRSMHATAQHPQLPPSSSNHDAANSDKAKQRYGRKCGSMTCNKVHGKKDANSGEVVRLTVQCELCESAYYCSKSCRRTAAAHHRESCSQRQTDKSLKDKKTKRVQCDTCKKVLPYTQMKKCSKCKRATCKLARNVR